MIREINSDILSSIFGGVCKQCCCDDLCSNGSYIDATEQCKDYYSCLGGKSLRYNILENSTACILKESVTAAIIWPITMIVGSLIGAFAVRVASARKRAALSSSTIIKLK